MTARAAGNRRKLVLVGWSGADWARLSPRLDRGELPALGGLIAGGTMGRLSSMAPAVSAAHWTSIVTGHRADVHGVLAATEPDPALGVLRPVSSRARRTAAVWEMVEASGLTSHVIAWPATDPVGPSRGVVVSDQFAASPPPHGEPWPVEPGSLAPGRVVESLAALRVHADDLVAAQLTPFVPRLAEVDPSCDHRPAAVASVVAEAATVHAAATWVLEHEPWDLVMVHHASLSRLGERFARYAEPASADVSARDAKVYGEVVTAGDRFFDLMLARLVALAGDDATVLVVAHPGGSAAGRGLFVAAGPGLRRDELIHGAGPLDIAPTVLALFGLPTADDLPGRPLVAAWQRPPRVASIASWDDRVARPDPADSDSDSDPAGAVADLVAQGYDDGPPPWLPELVRRSRLVEDFHRAMVHLDARRPARAAEALERLHDEAPGDVAVALYLAYAHAAVGNAARARELLGSIGDDHEDRPLRELVEAMILIGEGHSSEAAARLDRAVATHRAVPEVFTLIGHADLTAGRPEAAARSFARALAIDGERADAHEGLAQAHLRLRRWEAAADAALSALGLDHHRPEAHLTLGLALRELGRLDRAAQAFRTALDLRPTLRSRP